MAFSDSMFMFEITVVDLKSLIDAQRFRIRCKFGDIFTLYLRDPNRNCLPEGILRGNKKLPLSAKTQDVKGPVPTAQTVEVASNINNLALNMQKYPMYLCIWGKGNHFSLGSANIPWSPIFIDYLECLKKKLALDPVVVSGKYGIFNEYTSKRMATITLRIKLTRMEPSVQNKVEQPKLYNLTPSYVAYNNDPETNVSLYSEDPEEIGIIKTFYGGGKRLKSPQKANEVEKDPKIKDSKHIKQIEEQEKKHISERAESAKDKMTRFGRITDDKTNASGKVHFITSHDDTDYEVDTMVQDLREDIVNTNVDYDIKSGIVSLVSKRTKRAKSKSKKNEENSNTKEGRRNVVNCKTVDKTDSLVSMNIDSDYLTNNIKDSTSKLDVSHNKTEMLNLVNSNTTKDIKIHALKNKINEEVRKNNELDCDINKTEIGNIVCHTTIRPKSKSKKTELVNKTKRRNIKRKKDTDSKITTSKSSNIDRYSTAKKSGSKVESNMGHEINVTKAVKVSHIMSEAKVYESKNETKESKINVDRNFDKIEIVNPVFIRSNTETNIRPNTLIKSKSCCSVEIKKRYDLLDYIFFEDKGPVQNPVYCVGYCTVKTDNTPPESPPKSTATSPKSTSSPNLGDSPPKSGDSTPKSGDSPPKSGASTPKSVSSSQKLATTAQTSQAQPSSTKKLFIEKIKSVCPKDESERHGSGKYTFKICGDDCQRQGEIEKCFENVCSLDLPEEAAHMIAMKKCTNVLMCPHKRNDGPPPKEEDKLLLDIQSLKCCQIQKVDEVEGGMKMTMDTKDPCFCTCECKFQAVRRTTYCTICGGYEIPGEPGTEPPKTFPCPIFHKLAKPKKGEGKKKKKAGSDGESNESEKDSKKKRKTDDRFKFNYGYKGIPPQIGHSQCAISCGGAMINVPKHMGWLWNSNNVLGLKFRPYWRPGAINKHVLNLLRIAKNPEIVLAKRKKKEKPKRSLKRPLLTVEKKDGEYTVTMETMKTFPQNRPRLPNAYPYEDKPLVTFKIGRTEEENAKREKAKAHRLRRLHAEQREFIQSTFQDLCKDICYKTYQQALGLLPGDEDPPCPCLPLEPGPERVDYDQPCACSDRTDSSDATVTDDDEWLVEFTPPNAQFDPNFKGKKIYNADAETQYTYLDYKVKLVDRYGNPVPRYFIGPDGKQQCSDLGGFWDPDHKWLEINVDGFVGPDARWAPNGFLGPNGEYVEAEGGKFQALNGKWLIVGVDGYVENGKWHNYARPRPLPDKLKKQQKQQKEKEKQKNKQQTKMKHQTKKGTKKEQDKKAGKHVKGAHSETTTWSCFGDTADPKELGKMGITGHGLDRRLLLTTLRQMMGKDRDVVLPTRFKIPPPPGRSKDRRGRLKPVVEENPDAYDSRKYFSERDKCHHPPPSDKGVQAVDEHGRKTYFRLRHPRNARPQHRMYALSEKGISISSFHVPCMSSFIDSEMARQQNIEHILRHNARMTKAN